MGGGACRWRGGVRPGEETEGRRGACLCPATTEELCTKDRPACYFHTDRKSQESTCISKPERFYYQLARLLAKRGKKDFSMKIQYGASGALGYLPMGLQGPAMIGRGNPYLGLHDARHFGTFGSQGARSFGFAPNYEYRTGQGFGGFGGILVNPSTPSSTPPWAMATSNQTFPRPLPHRNLTCRLLKRVRRRNAMVAFSSRVNFPLGCDQGNVYEIFHILNLKCMLDDTTIKTMFLKKK